MKQKITEILQQNGIFVDNVDEDIDLTEYIDDSLQFINLIVSLEEELNIIFPDELISFDSLKSFNNFCNIVMDLTV